MTSPSVDALIKQYQALGYPNIAKLLTRAADRNCSLPVQIIVRDLNGAVLLDLELYSPIGWFRSFLATAGQYERSAAILAVLDAAAVSGIEDASSKTGLLH